MKKILVLMGVVVLSSCSVFGNERVRHSRTTSLVGFLYPDGTIPAEQKSPVLHLPLRVGLAFIPEQGSQNVDAQLKYSLLKSVKQSFEYHDYIERIEIIPSTYLSQGKSTQQLAQIKQLYQLDVMALVSYDQIVNRQENLLAAGYLTIVGSYIFPGSKFEVSTLLDLALIDLDSKRLLLRAAGSHGSKGTTAEAYTKQRYRKHQNTGFEDAMQQLNANLAQSLFEFEERLRKKDPSDDIKVVNKPGFQMQVPWQGALILSLLSMWMLIRNKAQSTRS